MRVLTQTLKALVAHLSSGADFLPACIARTNLMEKCNGLNPPR